MYINGKKIKLLRSFEMYIESQYDAAKKRETSPIHTRENPGFLKKNSKIVKSTLQTIAPQNKLNAQGKNITLQSALSKRDWKRLEYQKEPEKEKKWTLGNRKGTEKEEEPAKSTPNLKITTLSSNQALIMKFRLRKCQDWARPLLFFLLKK